MTAVRRATALIAALLAATGAASASDYSNLCTSGDRRYVMDDGVLYRATDKAQKQKLGYAILERQVLEERSGHCIASGGGANGQKVGFNYLKTRLGIAIDEAGGQTRRATMLCEMSADGLPAAWNCAHEVVKVNRTTPGPVQRFDKGSAGSWDHNGSTMRLEAEGTTRRIYYMNPRKGLRDVGVSGDTILFEGERQGNRYTGTARWFSKQCGEQTFPVSGTVSEDEHRIELAGTAPRVDGRCKPSGTFSETLVFTLNR